MNSKAVVSNVARCVLLNFSSIILVLENIDRNNLLIIHTGRTMAVDLEGGREEEEEAAATTGEAVVARWALSRACKV